MKTNEPISNTEQASNPPVTETPTSPKQVASKLISMWFLVILVVLLLGATGTFAYKYFELKQQIGKQPIPSTPPTGTTVSPSPVISPKPTIGPTANWEIYQNDEYGFSFKYPNNFNISNSLAWRIEKPFYTLEDPVDFGIALIQDINADSGQIPLIKIQLVKTSKSINQVLDQLKIQIEESKEAMNDPKHMYSGLNPPEIHSIEVVRVGSIEATKVERYQGPGAPNQQSLEYYVESPSHIFILTAKYGTYNPDVGQDGTVEKETLSKIITTFRFLN